MARPKNPDGKRVTMSTRFSEPEAERIDAARGDLDRSEWLRSAALASLAAGSQEPQRDGSRKAARPGREPESTSDIMAALRRRKNGGQ